MRRRPATLWQPKHRSTRPQQWVSLKDETHRRQVLSSTRARECPGPSLSRTSALMSSPQIYLLNHLQHLVSNSYVTLLECKRIHLEGRCWNYIMLCIIVNMNLLQCCHHSVAGPRQCTLGFTLPPFLLVSRWKVLCCLLNYSMSSHHTGMCQNKLRYYILEL